MRQVQQKAQAVSARDFRKSYIKLLTAVASAPKAVDNYFFGTADERTDEESEIRPYFYGSISFGILVTIGLYVII